MAGKAAMLRLDGASSQKSNNQSAPAQKSGVKTSNKSSQVNNTPKSSSVGNPTPPLLSATAVSGGQAPQSFADSWLAKHNAYLATLRDPVAVAGVRIPNGLSPRTVTLQYVKRQLLLTNGQGVCGAIMGYNGSSNNVGASNPAFMVPQGITGASIPAIAWICGSGSSTTQMIGETFASGHNIVDATDLLGFLQNYASKARVVSAAMNLQPAVGFEKADGTYIAGSLPPNFFSSYAFSGTNASFAALQNYPGSIWAPIYNPKSPGVTCTYTPTDESCQNFGDVAKTQVNYTDADYNSIQPGVMYAFASQATGDEGANHMLTIVINYEIELLSGTLAFGASSVRNDPIAMATADNVRKEDPLCFIGSDMFGMSPVSVQHPQSLDIPGTSVTHAGSAKLLAVGVRVPRLLSFSRVGGNLQCKCDSSVKTVEELEDDKPVFESLVDSLGNLVKKGLPNLIPLLKKI